MKIFLVGLLVVALTDINMAAPSDNGKNDGRENKTNKSQLDMLLAQLQRQQDQILRLQDQVDKQQHKSDEQQQQQRLQTKQQELKNEELQLQLEEQQEENKDQRREINELRQQQQHKNDKQQQDFKASAKVNRARRFDNDTVEHLKELIRDEINPLIAGLSQCQTGKYHKDIEYDGRWTVKISFRRPFTREPTVIASVGRFFGSKKSLNPDTIWGVMVDAQSPSTTDFNLFIMSSSIYYLSVEWIACA